MEHSQEESRRQFLKTLGVGVAGVALSGAVSQPASQPASMAAASEITLVELGKTGIKVSRIALGSGSATTLNLNVIRAALSRGITMLDTANSYGHGASEQAVGQATKAFGRDKVIIQTKASGARASKGQTAAQIEQAVRTKLEESLKRLQTDYIDIYLMHGTSNEADVDLPELREVVEKLKKEGKIRSFGLSTHSNYDKVCEAAIAAGWYDVIMPAMSMPNFDADLREAVAPPASGPAPVAAAEEGDPDAQPRPAQKAGQARRGGSRNKPVFLDMAEVAKKALEARIGFVCMKGSLYIMNSPGMIDAIKARYPEAAKKYSAHQLCYRWMYDQPFCNVVNIGTATMQHLEEALALPSIVLA